MFFKFIKRGDQVPYLWFEVILERLQDMQVYIGFLDQRTYASCRVESVPFRTQCSARYGCSDVCYPEAIRELLQREIAD